MLKVSAPRNIQASSLVSTPLSTDRGDPYWIDFELVPVPGMRTRTWRMWVDHGVEFFVHPAMQAAPELGFPEFFRRDRDGRPRGIIQVVKVQET